MKSKDFIKEDTYKKYVTQSVLKNIEIYLKQILVEFKTLSTDEELIEFIDINLNYALLSAQFLEIIMFKMHESRDDSYDFIENIEKNMIWIKEVWDNAQQSKV